MGKNTEQTQDNIHPASLLMTEEEVDAKWEELFNSPESEAFFDKMGAEIARALEAGELEDLDIENL